jgi:UDP-N-acetylmuramate--alanine ligase
LQSIQEYKRLKNLNSITAIWQPHKYSRTIDNLEAFVSCFEGVDELIILPVWAASETEQFIDFEKEFSRYNLSLIHRLNRVGDTIELIKDDKVIKTLDKGLIVGFGAGDITYQIRGIK